MTFEVAKEEFKDYLLLERAFSKNTILAYIRNIEKLESFLNSTEKLQTEDVQPEHLTSFVRHLNDEHSYSTSTQGQIIATLKSFFKFLVIDQDLIESPAEFLTAPKKHQLLPNYLSVKEVRLILNAAHHHHPYPNRAIAIISTLYATGIRVSEMTNIKMEDLHFNMNMVKVLGKGNKERLVPIAEFAQANIKKYIETELNNFTRQKNYNTHLFITENGKPLQREYVWTLIKTLVKKVNIKRSISPHTFRHTLATHLKQNGADINTIKEILGHESISDTIRYSHLDVDSLRDTIENYHPVNINK